MWDILLPLFLAAAFFSQTDAPGHDFKLTCDPLLVETSVSSNAVLICHVKPPQNLSNQTVKWSLKWDRGKKEVHLRLNGVDYFWGQDPHFKGRTKLHGEGLSGGNISLTIFNISEKDQGNYTCQVTIEYNDSVSVSKIGNVTLVVNPGGSDDKRRASTTADGNETFSYMQIIRSVVTPSVEPDKATTAVIVGPVVAVLIVLAVLAGVLIYLYKKKRGHQEVPTDPEPPSPDDEFELHPL